VAVVGVRLGFVGQICLSLLFIPVARGSLLLRLVDIPFEHAAKYHVWLGHFTMAMFSLHGLAFVIIWAANGDLIAKVGVCYFVLYLRLQGMRLRCVMLVNSIEKNITYGASDYAGFVPE
jgi:hypothetical protein